MTRKQESGFTLLETMVSLFVLLAVTAIVMGGMNQMMLTQGTIANRTEMHSSVRGATELLEQEIGQAGKISLPTTPAGDSWVMQTAVVVGDFVTPDTPATKSVKFISLINGLKPTLFDQELLLVDVGTNQETITLTCAAGAGGCTDTWNATFNNTHLANSPISAPGAFATGVVPPAAGVTAGYAGYTNGSTGTTLKLYGDINGDGNMLYVEYTCDTVAGMLYRNQMAFNAAAKPAVAPSMAVLTNVQPNPPGPGGAAVPCFTYQVQTVGLNAEFVFVTDVAVTLTEQTQYADPQTHQFQTETKALLNVSPRNVFNAYLLARGDDTNRVQVMPFVTKNNILYP